MPRMDRHAVRMTYRVVGDFPVTWCTRSILLEDVAAVEVEELKSTEAVDNGR